MPNIPQATSELKFASRSQRYLNYLIDLGFFFLLSYLSGYIIGYIFFFIGELELLNQKLDLISNILSISIFLLYYSISERIFGKTLGKLITKTKVISDDGNVLKSRQVLVRTLCRLIPFEAFSFLKIKKGSGPRGLHDILSNTIVIKDI